MSEEVAQGAAVEQCSHPLLREVDGLYGYYRCPACGDFFSLTLTTRHTPSDIRRMAHWFLKALADIAATADAAEGGTSPNGLCQPTGAVSSTRP